MKIAPNRNYAVSLESVAMTDIVLIMFIFFFISFSLLASFNSPKTEHIPINLPEARHTESPDTDLQEVRISLSSEGPIYLEGHVVTLKELEETLRGLFKDNPSLGAVVYVDRLVPFKDVVSVLDIFNGIGIARLNIAALNKES